MSTTKKYIDETVKAIQIYEDASGKSVESLFETWFYDRELYEKIIDKSIETATIGVEYKEELKNIRENCAKYKDGRKPRKYMIDVINGWIIEDATVVMLRDAGFNAELNGKDSEREFLAKPSKEPDISLSGRNLETKSDNTGYCKNTGYYDLKKKSYKALKNTDLVLLRLVESEQYFVFTKESCNVLGEGKAYGEPSKMIEVPQEEIVDPRDLKTEFKKFV